ALCSSSSVLLDTGKEDVASRISCALKIWWNLEGEGSPIPPNPRSRPLPDLYTYSILTYALAKHRMGNSLEQVMGRMWKRHFPTEPASAIPYNAAITGATDARDWHRVRWVYGQMRGRGQPMTSHTVVALLRASIHQGNTGAHVNVLLSEMGRIAQLSKVSITARHWTMVVDAYGRCGDVHGMEKALREIGQMTHCPHTLDPEDEGKKMTPQVLLGTFIAGMARAGDMVCVARLWEILEAEGWPFLPSMAMAILRSLQLRSLSSGPSGQESRKGKDDGIKSVGVERVIRALLRDDAPIDRPLWIMAVRTAVQQGRRRDARNHITG
ncbi:hypothetical protein BJ684DRAFT_17435, partial [Piptocephalis cylindrospora]